MPNAEEVLESLRARKAKNDEYAVHVKHDSGKHRYELIPYDALDEIVLALQHGAEKYTDNNWTKCKSRVRYWSAAMRHMTAWMRRETRDPESGLHHLAHAGCCILFCLALDLREAGVDDRA